MSDALAAFERGREEYRSGVRRIPRCPYPESEFNPCSIRACEWLGYMVERGLDLMAKDKERRRLRNYIELGHDL
jgi:hypothetical protein